MDKSRGVMVYHRHQLYEGISQHLSIFIKEKVKGNQVKNEDTKFFWDSKDLINKSREILSLFPHLMGANSLYK